MKLAVEIVEHKYPRKNTEYSLWLIDEETPAKVFRNGTLEDGYQRVFCAHPTTEKDRIDQLALIFQYYIDNAPDACEQIEKYVREVGI